VSGFRISRCFGRSRQVLISALCPDLALADLARNQISANQVELGSELGKGGFATVFRGVWKGREVAVKQMHACSSQEEFSEFQREAWIMGGLRSPYLVKLLGVCLEPPMLVMVRKRKREKKKSVVLTRTKNSGTFGWLIVQFFACSKWSSA
jgi:serine/threonine protein kinase